MFSLSAVEFYSKETHNDCLASAIYEFPLVRFEYERKAQTPDRIYTENIHMAIPVVIHAPQ